MQIIFMLYCIVIFFAMFAVFFCLQIIYETFMEEAKNYLCTICAIVMLFLHSRYRFFLAFRKEFQKLGGAFTTLGKSFTSDERTGKDQCFEAILV